VSCPGCKLVGEKLKMKKTILAVSESGLLLKLKGEKYEKRVRNTCSSFAEGLGCYW
jgi:hypothetical protein